MTREPCHFCDGDGYAVGGGNCPRCGGGGKEPMILPPDTLAREICICAAIRLPDGRVIRGHRHHNCFHAIAELATVDASVPSGPVATARFEQGFVTSRNRFVGREEGVALQIAAGIPSADTVRKGYGNQLFSEDLY